jgi:hypothetical protein
VPFQIRYESQCLDKTHDKVASISDVAEPAMEHSYKKDNEITKQSVSGDIAI